MASAAQHCPQALVSEDRSGLCGAMTAFPTLPDTGPDPLSTNTRVNRLAILVLMVSLVAILLTFRGHLVAGGHSWNTADWLINSDIVHVRRGLFGSAVLRASDALAISPVLAVILLQASLATVIAAGAIEAVLRSPSKSLAALLVMSPGFCLLFWAADPDGTARKEMVAYAAMALLLFTTGRAVRDRAIVIAAACLFAFGITGHIANAMMTPMFLYMAWVALGSTGRAWLSAAAMMCVWAAFNTWYPIRFSAIGSAMDVCRPLLERGLDEDLCADAVRVTAGNARAAVAHVAGSAFGAGNGLWHLIIYPALLVPFVCLVKRTDGWRLVAWPLALSVIPLLPLYLVGYDWGRQTVMHVTPMIFLVLLMLLRGRILQTRPISRAMIWTLPIFGLLWAPRHTMGIEFGMPMSVLLDALGV